MNRILVDISLCVMNIILFQLTLCKHHVCELSVKKCFAVAKFEKCLILQQAQI